MPPKRATKRAAAAAEEKSPKKQKKATKKSKKAADDDADVNGEAEKKEEKKEKKERKKKETKKKGSSKKGSKKGSKKAEAEEKSADGGGDGKAADRELHADLAAKLKAYRKKRAFNAKKWVNDKCKAFNDYLRKCGLKAAVVSVSGGIDSAVTLGLMKRAKEQKNSPLERILGIAQPIHSSDWALNRALETGKALDVEVVTVDQTDQHTRLTKIIDDAVGIKGKPFATGQLRSYMRTPVGFYIAQLLSQNGTPAVVMGTGNMDEDGYLAYFCKAGDGVVDVQLIADIHKSEVFKVAEVLGVPESTRKAAPSADLWPGQTDEDELGFSYDFVELYTGAYLSLETDADKEAWKADLSAEGKAQFAKFEAAAVKVHNRNKHKLTMPFNINLLKPSSVEAQ